MEKTDRKKLCTVEEKKVEKASHKEESKVVALDLEGLSVLQVAIHNFEDWVRQSHA
jgi:hypothetical protein